MNSYEEAEILLEAAEILLPYTNSYDETKKKQYKEAYDLLLKEAKELKESYYHSSYYNG